MNKAKLFLLIAAAIVFAAAPFINNDLPWKTADSLDKTFAGGQTLQGDILDKHTYSQLADAGEVTMHPAPSSTGEVAILIPQTHKYPGTEAADSKNDSATVAQGQIYNLISSLAQDKGIRLVMVEGELEGTVSQAKIDSLAEKMRLRNELESKMAEIAASDNLADGLSASAEKLVRSVDREVILAGAPLKLKAEGMPLSLFGSEDKSLMSRSAEIVRQTVYLNDRLSALKGASGFGTLAASPTSIEAILSNLVPSGKTGGDMRQQLLRRLQSYRGGLDSSFSLDILNLLGGKASPAKNLYGLLQAAQAKAAGNPELSQDIREASKLCQELDSTNAKSRPTVSGMPSRQDNPYRNVTSINRIRQMMSENEQELKRVVVDQRNAEAADAFVRMLDSQGQSAGIITFGSEHKDGLVKELNDRGVSVVSIVPKEVKQRTR